MAYFVWSMRFLQLRSTSFTNTEAFVYRPLIVIRGTCSLLFVIAPVPDMAWSLKELKQQDYIEVSHVLKENMHKGYRSALHWRHNDHDGVSNHQPYVCLLNLLFGRRSKKTSKLRVTDLCAGNSPGPVNSPHKGPVTRKMFPFDDVIMAIYRISHQYRH